MYTASSALIEALHEAGVSHIFANFGSDHPAILETLAEARKNGAPVPQIVTCPHEMVALSAALGFAQISGQAQAVFVHVETGTLNLGGAVHDAAKGRIPVLLFAGTSPFTQEGELRGSRNEFIHWIQDVFDQRGIVREYVKYDNEIRSGKNMKQIVHRAMQFASSDPQGPVYLVAGREVLEEEVERVNTNAADWPAVKAGALPPVAVDEILSAISSAELPLVVTSYLGRKREAVTALVEFCNRLGVGVLESVPNYVNYPSHDPLYVGNQWNEPKQNDALAQADVVLVLDSDVPWIPTVSKPKSGANIFHIDVDPLKTQMPLWYIHAQHAYQADCATALKQITDQLAEVNANTYAVQKRKEHWAGMHEERERELTAREAASGDRIRAEFLTSCVRRHLDDDSIVVHEGVTNSRQIVDHIKAKRPGSLFTSGGGALGWSGGAAVGAKLASPGSTVVCLTGDGSYLFSVPSSVHWVAQHYRAPFVQIVYNNRGWRAPKMSALAVHPDGFASRSDNIDVTFDPPPDYAGIAAAAGRAFAATVRKPDELGPALERAFDAVRQERRSAVVDVWLPQL